MDFGKQIRLKREELGITQEELAYKLGYKSKSTICNIEQGFCEMSYKKLPMLCQILKIDQLKVNGFTIKNTEGEISIENVKSAELNQAKEILCRQLELLAEKAYKAPATEMCSISEAMVKIVDCMDRIN